MKARSEAERANQEAIRAELGVPLWQQEHHAEAEPILRRALETWQHEPGPNHPWGHWGLANVLRDAGQPAEAEEHYRKALAIRRKALPAGHPEIRQSIEDYAKLLRAQGRAVEAAELEGS